MSATSDVDPLETLATSLGLVYSCTWSRVATELLFLPELGPDGGHLLEDGLDTIEKLTGQPLPHWLLPLAWVDESSIAVVVTDSHPLTDIGEVRRLHLGPVSAVHQLALLDIDPLLYVESLDLELRHRSTGARRMYDEIGPTFEAGYLDHAKRPRDYVLRPVRLACQNVIVGLAAIAQESSFDGLSVPAWQTCEVPHLATHEGNRALAALTLCDAFQNGGTMEIRFDRPARIRHNGKNLHYKGHPEGGVPASLKRFGRAVGIALGATDPGAISPAEARALFEAITPMPNELRDRVAAATRRYGLTPERICFALLAGVWSAIELDFLLACATRADTILAGGSDWTHRSARQTESEQSRAAVLVGMFARRVNSLDAAAAPTAAKGDDTPASDARVVEDRKRGIAWTVADTTGLVTLAGLDADNPIPWSRNQPGHRTVRILPRAADTAATIDLVADLVARTDEDQAGPVALLIPRDVPEPELPPGAFVLRCPDRLADIDKTIERRLSLMRTSRA